MGIGNAVKKVVNPTKITSLDGIPIAFIACGGYHSFAVSKSGAVFGWGKNTFGKPSDVCFSQLHKIWNSNINCRSVGHWRWESQMLSNTTQDIAIDWSTQRSGWWRFFRVFNTWRRCFFMWWALIWLFYHFIIFHAFYIKCSIKFVHSWLIEGAGTFGQLGHGNKNNLSLPRMVVEMMGTQVTQVACGARHTLTYVPSRGRVYSYGLNSCGQLGWCFDSLLLYKLIVFYRIFMILGTRSTTNSAVPIVVVGPWVSSLIDLFNLSGIRLNTFSNQLLDTSL